MFVCYFIYLFMVIMHPHHQQHKNSKTRRIKTQLLGVFSFYSRYIFAFLLALVPGPVAVDKTQQSSVCRRSHCAPISGLVVQENKEYFPFSRGMESRVCVCVCVCMRHADASLCDCVFWC